VPMVKILGPELGQFIRKLHQAHGVIFHTMAEVTAIDQNVVMLKDGQRIEADFIVAGIGVKRLTGLAGQAGLATDHGVTVDGHLKTSVKGIFAAGDIARWPDPHSGQPTRVEHWVVAQRQGQVAARNMLGRRERFEQVPFFWTIQHDFGLGYIGHAAEFGNLVVGQFEI
jgi:NADPH-dependent 2,4-dienoyl-CoA reductase/sulfur reductase-like enzyme